MRTIVGLLALLPLLHANAPCAPEALRRCAGTARAADAPATPDASQAREAAERELARREYQGGESLWTRLWRWISEHLDPSGAVPGIPSWTSTLIVVVVLLALLVVLALLLGRVTRQQRARMNRSLFAGDDRDSTALTRAASSADRGDWTTAVVERFRAIIRSLDERGALEDYPGMTAHEAATVAASVVVGHADDLHRAGVLFDAVRYGEIDPTFEQDVWMRDLADAIHRTQPAVEPALAEVPVHGRGGPL